MPRAMVDVLATSTMAMERRWFKFIIWMGAVMMDAARTRVVNCMVDGSK